MHNYKTIYKNGQAEIIEKKSRFIANVLSVESEDEALAKIDELKKKYWDARHNCFAYSIGTTMPILRFSDDGEPSGTAGKPILEVITGSQINNILIVVTRYFGGTLLGTGGLVRAYSAASKSGILSTLVEERIFAHKLIIIADYQSIGKIQYILSSNQISILSSDYSDNVTITALVPPVKLNLLTTEITEATRGKAELDFEATLYYSITDGKLITY